MTPELKELLESIQKQKLSSELKGDEYLYADFIGAYDHIIQLIRNYLSKY